MTVASSSGAVFLWYSFVLLFRCLSHVLYLRGMPWCVLECCGLD